MPWPTHRSPTFDGVFRELREMRRRNDTRKVKAGGRRELANSRRTANAAGPAVYESWFDDEATKAVNESN